MKYVLNNTSYVVCINNAGYDASLDVRKIYQAIPDEQADQHHLIRIIDESGEDYLYPAKLFVAVELPHTVTQLFEKAA